MASKLDYRTSPAASIAIQTDVAAFLGAAGKARTGAALTTLFVEHMQGLEVTKAAYVHLGCAGQALRPELVFGDDAGQLLESSELSAILQIAFATGRPFLWSPVWPDRVVAIEAARSSFIVAPVVGSNGSIGLVWAATPRHAPFSIGEQALFAAAAAAYSAVGSALTERHKEPPPRLTHRERECLAWASESKSDWMIGEILNLAERTVHMHVENAKRKMGVTSRFQAILRAWRAGLLVGR